MMLKKMKEALSKYLAIDVIEKVEKHLYLAAMHEEHLRGHWLIGDFVPDGKGWDEAYPMTCFSQFEENEVGAIVVKKRELLMANLCCVLWKWHKNKITFPSRYEIECLGNRFRIISVGIGFTGMIETCILKNDKPVKHRTVSENKRDNGSIERQTKHFFNYLDKEFIKIQKRNKNVPQSKNGTKSSIAEIFSNLAPSSEIPSKKDIFGIEIEIGDEVATIRPGTNRLILGNVVGFSSHGNVKIEFVNNGVCEINHLNCVTRC